MYNVKDNSSVFGIVCKIECKVSLFVLLNFILQSTKKLMVDCSIYCGIPLSTFSNSLPIDVVTFNYSTHSEQFALRKVRKVFFKTTNKVFQGVSHDRTDNISQCVCLCVVLVISFNEWTL